MKMILYLAYILTIFALGYLSGLAIQVENMPHRFQDAIVQLIG